MSEQVDNNTGGDGGPHMGPQRLYEGGKPFPMPPFTDEAVAGGITRQTMIDAAKLRPMYPCPVRRVFELGTLSEVADDVMTGEFDRRVMADILANAPAVPPIVGTPKDEPNPLAEMWQQSVGMSGLVSQGAYELEPTEFTPATLKPDEISIRGTMHLLPNVFETKTLLGDNMEETLKKCLAAYEGQAVTRQMIDKVSADVKAAIDAGRVMPFPIKFEPLNVDANLLTPRDLLDRGMEALINGFDWEKEQKAIAAEARYQATMQGKLQEEMEQSAYHLKAMQEEAAIDAELARMTDDGAKCPLPADPLLTIEPGEFHARVRDMVTRRHPDPACHMTADLKERRLKEEFLRHHIPPLPITDDELDRSVPTNLPVDATKDNHYQAFRRARGLPDTTDAMEEFCKYARINNGIAGTEKIPDAAIDTIGQLAIQARLSEKHIGVVPARYPLYDQDKKFVGWSGEPNPAGAGYAVTLPEGGLHVRPDAPVYAFAAFETIGAAIPHTGTVVKTDDPELMAALGDAIDQGRVVMDGDTIVSIDGVPTFDPDKLSDADKEAVLKNGWREDPKVMAALEEADAVISRVCAGYLLDDPKTPFEDDVQPDAVVG